jgi:hypothetical protein
MEIDINSPREGGSKVSIYECFYIKMDDNEVATLPFTLVISRELNMGCTGLHRLV